ncbi:MAG: hypothetical protein WC462_00810 [archaeon]
MIEVFFLVLIVVVIFVGFFAFLSYRDKLLLSQAEKRIVSVKEKIKIAERKFMQGKLKKSVFDSLVEDLEEELFSEECVLLRLKKASVFSSKDKVSEVVAKLDKPTKHRKARVEKILKEIELLRSEMSLLESKFLKREIKQSVFEKMIKKKESEMIQKEKELSDIVVEASEKSPQN